MECGASESLRAARRKQPRPRVPMAWVPLVVFYLALQGLMQPVTLPSPPPRAQATATAPPPASPQSHSPQRAQRCAPKAKARPPISEPRRPTTPRGLVRQADALLRAGRTEAAYDRYKAAVDADPRQVEGVLGCARTALRGGHLDRAHYWLSYARELKPRSRRLARLQERLQRHLEQQLATQRQPAPRPRNTRRF